jgi:CheY-like chemotaxis protein
MYRKEKTMPPILPAFARKRRDTNIGALQGHPNVKSLGTFADALEFLETRRFDLVILDVRLGGYEPQDTPPDEEEGVRTLQEIRRRRFVPVVFWTGLPERARHLEDPLVRVLDKTEGLPALAAAVRELFDTRLPAVNRALLRLIEDEQRRYMWDFVAKHWNELSDGEDHVALAYLLVRRLARSLSGPGIERLAQELGALGPGPPAPGTIHATEMYIVPPFEDTKPGVADLFREGLDADGERWWLLVTPSCDIEWDKAERVVLAACEPVDQDVRIQKWRETNSNNDRRRVEDLVGHKTGGQDDRYLFLPAAPTIPDLVADFQRLRSVTPDELGAMDRIASLVSPFPEAMVSRFIRYFGRVGTEDLDVETIMHRLKEVGSPEAPEEQASS